MGERLARAEALTGEYYPDLHAVYDFYYSDAPVENLRQFAFDQEMTHLAEGLELRQRSVWELKCIDGQVCYPDGRPMLDIAVEGLAAARRQQEKPDSHPANKYRVQRSHADITIAENCNKFMMTAEVGDTFLAVSPYAEELDDQVAAEVIGHWPERRRSFMWLFRKTGEDGLERVDVTVDQSKVATYKELFGWLGVEIPDSAESHDLPFFSIGLDANLASETERDEYVKGLRRKYYELQGAAVVGEDEREALDFLRENAGPLISVSVAVQEAVAESLRTGNLHSLLSKSAVQALDQLRCLNPRQRQDLMEISNGQALVERNFGAFVSLVRAQRYGIWEAMNSFVRNQGNTSESLMEITKGIPSEQVFSFIYGHTNNAAFRGAIEPGCSGGTRFLDMGLAEAMKFIFGTEDESQGLEDDIHGSRTFNCPKKGCLNTRWIKDELLTECQKCGAEIPKC